jgi:hypothetical protein
MIWAVRDNNVMHGDLTSVRLHMLCIGDPLNMIIEQCPDCCRWIALPYRLRYLGYRPAIEPGIFPPHRRNSLGCSRASDHHGWPTYTIRNPLQWHIRSGWYHASGVKSPVGLFVSTNWRYLQVLYGKQPYWWLRSLIHVVSAKYQGVEPVNSSIQIRLNHLDFMWRCWSTESIDRPSLDDVLVFLQKQQVHFIPDVSIHCHLFFRVH